MPQIQVKVFVGAEEITLVGSNMAELLPTLGNFRLMDFRVEPDSTFRFRKNDGGDFIEMYSRKLNATIYVSKEKDDPTTLYIDAKAPYVKYERATESNQVRYKWNEKAGIPDALAALGWTDEDNGVFRPAVKCKTEGKKGVKSGWSWCSVEYAKANKISGE